MNDLLIMLRRRFSDAGAATTALFLPLCVATPLPDMGALGAAARARVAALLALAPTDGDARQWVAMHLPAAALPAVDGRPLDAALLPERQPTRIGSSLANSASASATSSAGSMSSASPSWG